MLRVIFASAWESTGKCLRHDVINDVISCHTVSVMAQSKAHNCEIVKLYYQTKSLMKVVNTMKRTFPELDKLNTKALQRLVKRFEESGSVEDRRHSNPVRPRKARTDDAIEEVKTAISDTPQRSVRRVLGDITNSASMSSVYRMLKYDLHLTPYKISIMQHLKENGISSRLAFAHWMNSHTTIVNELWFSDEAHFYLNAVVNKQNCRFWGTERPESYIEKPLHGEKVTAWAALSVHGVIGPFFFEGDDGHVTTVNKDR